MIEIAFRIQQPVDVIDSQSSDLACFDQSQHVLMHSVINIFAFGAESDQVADVEKPAVIDAVCGFAPVGEPVVLSRKNSIKSFYAENFSSNSNRQLLFEVAENGTAILDCEPEFVILEGLAVRFAENRQQDFLRFPIYVKELRVSRSFAFLEYIEPPWIIQARSHMVRHNVQYQTHAPGLKCAAQFFEFFKSAELWVESRRIGYIVTMRGAGARF